MDSSASSSSSYPVGAAATEKQKHCGGGDHHHHHHQIDESAAAAGGISSKRGGKRASGVKLSTDAQSVAARERRHRISERFKILQSLVPGGSKMDTVSMLEEAIHYVKFLKTQIYWLHRTMIITTPTTILAHHCPLDHDHLDDAYNYEHELMIMNNAAGEGELQQGFGSVPMQLGDDYQPPDYAKIGPASGFEGNPYVNFS